MPSLRETAVEIVPLNIRKRSLNKLVIRKITDDVRRIFYAILQINSSNLMMSFRTRLQHRRASIAMRITSPQDNGGIRLHQREVQRREEIGRLKKNQFEF